MPIQSIKYNNFLAGQGVDVQYRQVPSHENVEGNENMDTLAKMEARNKEEEVLELQERFKG
jgi:ribonuclease HI